MSCTSDDNFDMPIKKGDKVRARPDGPVMEVRAAGDSLAICEWLDAGAVRQATFSVSELMPVVTQYAQQPQPTEPPAEN
jgi:uncharacterized protein YodC (DUF2158 family)